ncbi:hypothetical protein, partial [Paraburkholderia sp. EG304]|uniref:hypothetical protein n=1 Tax=Paraburkholderia sp. EG304 TaxID=3237015 RepID=UPI00397E2747
GNNGHGFPLLWVLMKAQTSSWHFDAEPRLPPQPRDGEVPYIRIPRVHQALEPFRLACGTVVAFMLLGRDKTDEGLNQHEVFAVCVIRDPCIFLYPCEVVVSVWAFLAITHIFAAKPGNLAYVTFHV